MAVEEKEAGKEEVMRVDGVSKKPLKGAEQEAELSDEDAQLKRDLELLVERTGDPDAGVQALALESIRNEIRTATTSMTSVPKPLKFLRSHYDDLKERFNSMEPGENRASLADIISVLAMTTGKEGARETLKYRLAGSKEGVGSWGHEYVRSLAGEIGQEYQEHRDQGLASEDLLELVVQIVPYHMSHNAEPEAVDLLLEVDKINMLQEYVDDNNFQRTCRYLANCSNYLAEPDDRAVLHTALDIYLSQKKYSEAMRMALKANDQGLIEKSFAACSSPLVKKQLCHLLARQGVALDLNSGAAAVEDDDLREALQQIISNTKLSEMYLSLARDLDVMEPKTADEVYKMHLVEGRATTTATVDSARQNLANTFVNALVNAGFGNDKLMMAVPEQEGTDQVHWIFKNKDHGKISATASLGMITLWDVEGGLPQIDKYLYTPDQYVKAGALLAVGIVNCGVQDECDPAFALLYEHVNASDTSVRVGAIMGLGLAYAGTQKEEVRDLLIPLVTDPDVSMEVAGFAALSLGLTFTSTTEEECVQTILQALMMRPEADLSQSFANFLALGLGLLFLGKQDAVEATVEVAKTLNERISKFAQVTLESLAYAGTGDVLKVQGLLAQCGEHIETDELSPWKAVHQSSAVMGIALIAMSEDLGSEMAHRALEHLLQYGDPAVRRGVPLAVALLNVSNPTMSAMDTCGRLSHDTDAEVAQNAILALGIIGAGTNNARLAGLLRGLSSYYYKEPTMLFLVRISQGLVHMGKGLLSLNPYHSDRQLLSGPALAGILGVLYSCLDMKGTVASKHHSILYYLATAMKPRMLMTMDEEGKMLPVPVRVGQAVDVVAQAGRPKAITGFQTHTTPVLLTVGERAELATEKYTPLSSLLEGVVILSENPDYIDMHE